MNNYVEYSTHYVKEIDAGDYVRRYRNVGYFENLCRQCPNYGRRWACPPISGSYSPDLSQYSKVILLMVKICIKPGTSADADTLRAIIEPTRARFEHRMLEAEKELGGTACLFTGQCPHCPGRECARIAGDTCRHPDLVRPSLEALGFNLETTARDIFDTPILWCDNSHAPRYMTLMGGLFHNNTANKTSRLEFFHD